ncbi:hypothetical protein [Kushneria phyllosphaerae]|uniref:hypothetical protein n=1 Tax=Kushneria phyllosphaerae TaxID=2100822 RepID=UPI000D55F54E|nr:hypothetical protein [Kushneria phyllosphaerae]
MAALDNFQNAIRLVQGITDISRTGGDLPRHLTRVETALVDLEKEKLAVEKELQAVKQRVHELERQLGEHERFDLEEAHYEDRAFPSGAWVVVEKAQAALAGRSGDSVLIPKYFCQACFERKKRSILQPDAASQPSEVFVCHLCGLSVPYKAPMRSSVTFC